MRKTWLGLALLAIVAAGAAAAWFSSHRAAPPPVAAATVKPPHGSLLRVSHMLQVTAPVAVPGGYEAAAWDTTGRVTFWKWARSDRTWRQVGRSTYPELPATYGTPRITVTGALLKGMSHATFIVSGQFSGDGTGNFIAFTDGRLGWGTIAPGQSGVLIPTGRMSTDNRTPGNSYTEVFSHGYLEIVNPGYLPFGPNGEEWQIGRTYAWRSRVFRQIATTQFTAAQSSPLPMAAPQLSANACQGSASGIYKAASVSASTLFPHPASVSRPYLPTSVTLRVDGGGASCHFTVTPDFPIVISAAAASGQTWLTAPAWVLTDGAHGTQDIGDMLPGTRLPGNVGMGAVEFQNAGWSPYYIPRSLGVRRIGRFGSAVIQIRNGKVAALTVLP